MTSFNKVSSQIIGTCSYICQGTLTKRQRLSEVTFLVFF